MENNSIRKSNFELLRIIMMILIVLHHYIWHGNFNIGSPNEVNNIILECLGFGGKIGINVFILITGYFMISSEFKLRKVLIIYGELLFYSAIISVGFGIFHRSDISVGYILDAVFPFITNRHNYITSYLILYCLIPFINKLINVLEKKEYEKLIIFLMVVMVIIPSIMSIRIGWVNNVYSYVFWMIFIYIVGGYIRLYMDDRAFKSERLLTCIAILGTWGITVICGRFKFINTYYFISNTYTIPIFITSVMIFVCFKNINIKHNRLINYISASVLAVYLIHDDVLIRNWIWSEIFKGNELTGTRMLVVNLLASTFVVFFICIALDKIRINTVEKVYIKLLNRIIK